MKVTQAKFVCAPVALALTVLIGLSACSTANSESSSAIEGLTGGVAATVNGQEIMEDEVTTYIENFRASQGMADEDAWGSYLASMSTDPAKFREETIDYYASFILIEQAATERGIAASDEELDAEVEAMRTNYGSDEEWLTALTQAGFTEESYRDSVRDSILAARLEDAIGEEVEPVSDDELLEAAQMYADYIDGGRRSSHILFNIDDEATANEVLEKLRNGELEFEDAAKEYSQDGSGAEGGDVGWDRINSFVTEYQQALDELDEGEMSDLVESQYGYHIIKCTEIYHAPEDGVTALDQVPEDLIEVIRTQLESGAKTTAVTEWYTEYKEAADIVINDMPEGLPYDLDMTKYQTADSSEDSDLVVEAADEGPEGASEDDAEATDEETPESPEETDAVQDVEVDADKAEDAASEQPAEISPEAETRSE